MLTDEARQSILESILETIKWISDKEYQKRVWIRGEGPEVNDFDETCNFFCDVDPVLEEYKDFRITENQYQILKKFRDEFLKFSEENNLPQLFIDTPEWTKITLMAKEVLDAFGYQNRR